MRIKELAHLLTKKQFIAKYPFISSSNLDFWIYQRKKNGLAETKALIKTRRRILIDDKKFLDWLNSYQILQ